nr:endoglucanase 18-like [Physcomitrium patens]|eukprot:XP_024360691.1 endoglucanase 18-like [Physcomitrella patens]
MKEATKLLRNPKFASHCDCKIPIIISVVLLLFTLEVTARTDCGFNYTEALYKGILFFEGQRSGKLPEDQRMTWRGDSALTDGSESNVDLTGGYYDAGDNVKYQFPMAFSITMLSWSVIQYKDAFRNAGQLKYAQQSVKWGTDYFLKCVTGPTQLWVQAGDPNSDHNCWERPEDMDTPRTVHQINASSPGTEVAAETAAALAAASIVFKDDDAVYSEKLLDTAMTVFDFANSYRGAYSDACPFYCSTSGYDDELLWAAAWLYKASSLPTFLQYVVDNSSLSYVISEFSWDNKHAGLQILLSSLYFSGETSLQSYPAKADAFLCSTLPQSSQKTVTYTPGGLLYIREGANMQYVAGSSFLAAVYGDALAAANRALVCGSSSSFTSSNLLAFAKSQLDYVLGNNPLERSYMAGFGRNPPVQFHHRGASIASIRVSPEHVGCGQGYVDWFHSNNPNPNVLTGAIVGGPNSADNFTDFRNVSSQTEPTTYINAAFVGVIAKFVMNLKPGEHSLTLF